MSKVILVVCDGLRDDTAAAQMGYLEHLVEHRLAERFTVIAEMPTMSRPLYETLHTGTPPYIHGVTSNNIVRLSNMPNIFGIASQAGKVTAAAASSWISELYNAVPYDLIEHGEVDDPHLPIQHGRFYVNDSFPDSELFIQAERMVRRFAPDYLLIHPMGMDDTGHHHGPESHEYNNHAIFIDQVLAGLVPDWQRKGYAVLVTADHGMNAYHMHGGSLGEVRRVPLYRIGPAAGEARRGEVSQLSIAPTVLALLGLPAPDTMHSPALV
jgi:predicted AlkP superfamily pyrophosphatase or phosphodiesterase